MASLFRQLTAGSTSERQGGTLPLNFQQWVDYFSFNNNTYPYIVHNGNQPQDNQEIGGDFAGYIDGIYARNGVVFACIAARQLLFSEARFQFRRQRTEGPGDLFGTPALEILENPWENATTGDLLTRAELDVALAGNFYAARRGNALRRLRPDWVTILLGTRTGSPIDIEVAGYAYQEGGTASGNEPIALRKEDVVH